MSENNKKDFEEDIYKDAPGLDTDLEWEEEAYYLDLIYKSIDDELCDSTEITDNGLEIKNGVLLHYHGNETEVVIPDSITEIRAYDEDTVVFSAFGHCKSLKRVVIPASVMEIGHGVFIGCENLESIVVDSNNSVYHSKDNCLIETETKTLIAGCKNSIIPADGSVTAIADAAFAQCTWLENIVIPQSVRSIGWEAFDMCESLTSIVLPESVTYIAMWAFAGCSSVKRLVFPKTIQTISANSFLFLTSLESIEVDSDNPYYHSKGNCLIETESKTLIMGCKSSIIPTDGSVVTIGAEAFWGCKGLESIVIPDTVTTIEEGAFGLCNNLKSITIPNSVTHIGNRIFTGCHNIAIITPDGSYAEKYAKDDGKADVNDDLPF